MVWLLITWKPFAPSSVVTLPESRLLTYSRFRTGLTARPQAPKPPDDLVYRMSSVAPSNTTTLLLP